MLSTFLNHQWKAFRRSRNKGGTIAAQIFMGFMVLYLLAIALFLGFMLQEIIPKVFPGKDMMFVFNGFILYYFALDFVMRIQLQDLPTLSIVPYLHLNIPRNKIVSFLNVRAVFTAFNLFPLILFLPFCSTAVARSFGPLTAVMYCISIIGLCIFNNYLALYIKRLTTSKAYLIFVVMGFIAAIGLMEYFKVFSIAGLSNSTFIFIARNPFAALVFPAMAGVVFLINANYLRRNLYTEDLTNGEAKKASTDYPFLDRFGEMGTLIALELKLIFRHKRPRSAVIVSLIFIFYGFLFYKEHLLSTNSFAMMVFAATFMTGSNISIYGQFMFGWQGAHFDGLMVSKINIRNFIKAKFLMFTLASTLMTLVVSLYGFISWKILLIQFAAYLYNVGFGTVIILYFATRNYKAIDLSKSSGFNYQGVGASQFVLLLPYFLTPYLFYTPFALAGLPYLGIACIAFVGLLSLITRSYWVEFIFREFDKRKYKIAAGFREVP
ncbi:MAG TPA: DUF5687 family protein [Pedobacter sp.]|uniref:DUF5687 family protein n=1 Tax=Pedobacter sp. TaxID=1411316 RepID=UPI002D0C1E43|nr:DUF5687 family protein [Pedobacter sp.]HMI02772.1 DUF5687 family protein [Pedobacter sp.]